ncbi:MAG TPA: hypothetical protein VGM13_12785 [Thermoanaerobaculia bacterium]|jgi:hypothetical protein
MTGLAELHTAGKLASAALDLLKKVGRPVRWTLLALAVAAGLVWLDLTRNHGAAVAWLLRPIALPFGLFAAYVALVVALAALEAKRRLFPRLSETERAILKALALNGELVAFLLAGHAGLDLREERIRMHILRLRDVGLVSLTNRTVPYVVLTKKGLLRAHRLGYL